MEYLEKLLGIKVVYKASDDLHLPHHITSRYRIRKVMLDRIEVFFLYTAAELEEIGKLRKHISCIQKEKNIPVVLIPDRLTYRQKEHLLRERIPFVVYGKQIYLPFMAVYLQKYSDAERMDSAKLLPVSQVVLLYYIYHGCGRQVMSRAVTDLKLTSTSVSRAVRQLEELELLKTERNGVNKIIFSELTPKELFTKAHEYLQNPVKKTVYVPGDRIKDKLLFSGYSALAEYSMLNAPHVAYYASDSISCWDGIAEKKLLDGHKQVAVEFWRYDPKKLSGKDKVDPLSLALSLGNDADERVEESVEYMLTQVWRDIDGNRN